jgi:predicted TIM-barrel fold metal-dependent hydrolase
VTPTDERLTLISADCHAGGNHEMYRGYLEAAYLDEFDAWRDRYRNPFRDLTNDSRSRNWDDDRRLADLEADGIVAEVLFPNTIPPFFPTGAVIARPPTPAEYELRLAGIRAHNRWLADFCDHHPHRRAGIGQIFLNDVDDAIEDVRWCHAHGLRGGVLLPSVPDDLKHIAPLYAVDYDPLWAVCEDLGVVVNAHSGGTGMPDYGSHRAASEIWIAETSFFSRRPLTHLLLSGVFDRFPRLRFVLTESGCSWVATTLAQLDSFRRQARSGRIGELKYDADALPSMLPSEYFARNCWIGASFPSPLEAAARDDIGVDRYMWGSDYPHDEGTFPNTREGLRRAFAGRAEDRDLRLLLGGTAAHVYGFDLTALAPYAEAVGPTLAELATPYDAIPEGNRSPAFSRP